MSRPTIHWDDENSHHILVERAERGISRAEVEEVLLGSNTVRWFTRRGGRLKALGSTSTGRCLTVIYVGIERMRPVTAWLEKKQECERWRT